MEIVENHPITPDCILAGLGELDRKEIAGMIALLENAKLRNLLEEAVSKLKVPVQKMKRLEEKVSTTAKEIDESADDISLLRHRLWCRIQGGVGIDFSLPLATSTARRESVKLGDKVSRKLSSTYSSLTQDAPRSKRALDWIKRKAPFFRSQQNLEFGEIVKLEIVKLLGVLLKEDMLDEQTKYWLTNEIRKKFEDVPIDLKDEDLRKAISSGNWKIVGTILAGSSLGGVALAVELAGFSAYILAAKASAVIPFIGGKTAVSLLAVLANPAFFIFTIFAGWFVISGAKSSVKSTVASRIIVLISLKGVMNRRDGLAVLLNDFRKTDLVSPSALNYLSQNQCLMKSVRRKRVEELTGHDISSAPGTPPPPWDKLPKEKETEAIENFLSSDRQQECDQFDVLATGILTTGDFLYTAWSINPMVIRGADFSRAAEIGNVFEFAEFAERWKEMSSASAQGLENSLQGYTAEQLVLTRLIEDGHAVELADVSNTAGFDILVDGAPFQIKCGEQENISLLAEHFEKYENIPVISNAELAAGAAEQPWADQVFVVEDFDLETVRGMMSTALESGAAIDDLPVPFYAVIVGIARNLQYLKDGRMGLSDLPEEIIVEAAIRGTLTWVGMKAGALVGMIFFGPAGKIILPPVVAVGSNLFVSMSRQVVEKTFSRSWSKEVVELAVSLKSNALIALDRRLEHLNLDLATSHDPNTVESWLYARKLDDVIASAEQRIDIESQDLDTPSDSYDLLGKVVTAQLLDPATRRAQTTLIQKLHDKPKASEVLRKRARSRVEKEKNSEMASKSKN